MAVLDNYRIIFMLKNEILKSSHFEENDVMVIYSKIKYHFNCVHYINLKLLCAYLMILCRRMEATCTNES